MSNPNFYILYKDSSEGIIDFSQINHSDYVLEPLINDYLNGWVKFISVDGDPTSVEYFVQWNNKWNILWNIKWNIKWNI